MINHDTLVRKPIRRTRSPDGQRHDREKPCATRCIHLTAELTPILKRSAAPPRRRTHLNRLNHPLPQILRVRLRHRSLPNQHGVPGVRMKAAPVGWRGERGERTTFTRQLILQPITNVR